MELHRQGHFPIEKLCKVYPIKDFEQAIHDLHAGSVGSPYAFVVVDLHHRRWLTDIF